jgi:hypothetical protein
LSQPSADAAALPAKNGGHGNRGAGALQVGLPETSIFVRHCEPDLNFQPRSSRGTTVEFRRRPSAAGDIVIPARARIETVGNDSWMRAFAGMTEAGRRRPVLSRPVTDRTNDSERKILHE